MFIIHIGRQPSPAQPITEMMGRKGLIIGVQILLGENPVCVRGGGVLPN